MLALVAGERMAARAMHGDALTSLMGRHLYAKAAMLDAPPTHEPSPDPMRRALEEHVDVAFAPIRTLIESAPPDIRGVLTVYYETCLQGPCVPELADTIPWGGAEINDALEAVALDRLKRAPLGYAGLTARHYAAIWSAYKLRDPATVPVLNAFIATHRPLPFERRAFGLSPGGTLTFTPDPHVRMVQPAVAAIGWAMFGLALGGVAAAAARRTLPPSLAVAALAALTADGGLLFSVMLAAGLSRFIVSLWPAITTALLFAAFAIVDTVRTKATRPAGTAA
jgi:hypothetical protein